MKALITGITGMIGTHLAGTLREQGWEVAGISRSTSASRLSSGGDAAGGKLGFRHYAGDILDVRFLERVWREWQPDCVFHLAAQAYNAASWEAEETTYLLNVTGSRNVFHACRLHSPKARLIPACSSAEYGFVPPELMPIHEDRTPLRPVTPYGVCKAAMEMMARQFCLNYGLDVVMPRLFIHVGPDHPPGTALQNFARQLAAIKLGKQDPVLRAGNLDSARDFVDVRDGARALVLLADEGQRGEVYTIASGRAWSIREALQMLIGISGLGVEVRQQDPSLLRPSDEQVLLGDNGKLRALGWEPRVPFEQTLHDVYNNWLARLR